MSPRKSPVDRLAPNLAEQVSSPTWSPMTIFFGNRPRGFDSVRGRILPFSYLQAVAVNTVLALPRSLWLLYGLEACPLTKSGLQSLDFVINKFFMKLFTTKSIETVKSVNRISGSIYLIYYGPSAFLNSNTASSVFCLCFNRFVSVLYVYCLFYLSIAWWIKILIKLPVRAVSYTHLTLPTKRIV